MNLNTKKLNKELNILLNDGIKFLKKNNPKKALDNFQSISLHKPNNSHILNFLGLCHLELKNFNSAIHFIEKAIENESDEIGFYINLGNIYKRTQDYKKSLNIYTRALKINNRSSEIFYNIGLLYFDQHNYQKAKINYKKSLQITPNNKFALNNLGKTYKELTKFDEAEKLYNKAIEIDAGFLQAHFNLGILLLLKGRLFRGWEKYEYRQNKFKETDFIKNINKWDGSSLKNKTLLILCEQGIGDNVQFLRYAKKIKKQESKIFLVIKKNLTYLFKNINFVDKIFFIEDEIPYVDFYISLMSLPFIFRNEKNTPNTFKFIKINNSLKRFWKSKIDNSKNFKIGIMWQGDKINNNDFKRSIPLKKLEPILKLKGVDYFSLQKDHGRNQINLNNFDNLITDFYGKIDNLPFEDTVHIIDCLDMVITVCTSVAHISATMKKDTWIMLPCVPDFRWGLISDKTIWYDNVKLFRQKKINGWEEVISDLKKDLINKYKL